MLKSKKMLFLILMVLVLLLIPNVVKAEEFSKVEITIPEPVVGQKATSEGLDVTINGNIKPNEAFASWLQLDSESVGGTPEYFVPGLYCYCDVEFQLDEEYVIADDCSVFLNGQLVNSDEFGYFNDYFYYSISWGILEEKESNDTNNTISTIDITIPEPVGGQKVPTEEKIKVMLNGSNQTEIVDISWTEYDPSPTSGVAFPNPTYFEKGEGYACLLEFDSLKNYTFSSEVTINVNGNFYEKVTGSELVSEYYDGYILNIDFGEVKTFEPDDDYYDYKNGMEENASKVDIKIPIPTIGKKPASASAVTVTASNGEKVRVDSIGWYLGDPLYGNGVKVEKFEKGKKYSCEINLICPNGEGIRDFITNLGDINEMDTLVAYLDDRK